MCLSPLDRFELEVLNSKSATAAWVRIVGRVIVDRCDADTTGHSWLTEVPVCQHIGNLKLVHEDVHQPQNEQKSVCDCEAVGSHSTHLVG